MIDNLLHGIVVKNQINTDTNQVGLYFDVIQEHSLSLQSQITDNWLENNAPVNDHIANSPLVISLRGLSGELVYEPNNFVLDNIYSGAQSLLKNTNAERLAVIPALLPPVDNLTQLAKNTIQYAEASVKRYIKIFNRFKNPIQRAQRIRTIYSQLEDLRNNKTALIVRTPFAVFGDMYIQSLTLRQANELYITDLEISLKQLNFTETQTTKIDPDALAKVTQYERAEIENHGKVQGELQTNSAMYDMFTRGQKYTNWTNNNATN